MKSIFEIFKIPEDRKNKMHTGEIEITISAATIKRDRNDVYIFKAIHKEISYVDMMNMFAVEHVLKEANLNPDFDW